MHRGSSTRWVNRARPEFGLLWAPLTVIAIVNMLLPPLVGHHRAHLIRRSSRPPRPAAAPARTGYWLVTADGEIDDYGAPNVGSMPDVGPGHAIVGSAPSPDGRGLWVVAQDGGVFPFGAARFYGSLGGRRLNAPAVGMAVAPGGRGYWVLTADGGVFSFGSARFYGSLGGRRHVHRAVGIAAAPGGRGYWIATADGGVFPFGTARFYGSLGNRRLAASAAGMAAAPDGRGYWVVAADGGVFAFGSAHFHGSLGNWVLAQSVSSLTPTRDGGGYWLVARDGGVFPFGDARFAGSAANVPQSADFVGLAPSVGGRPAPPPQFGADVSAYQCPGAGVMPPGGQPVAIVQVSGGSIDGPGNPCYRQQAAWAGPSLEAYIFLDGLPSPAPPEAQNGPGGLCRGNGVCQSFNFGWAWTRHWLATARAAGTNPPRWWLDVENTGQWLTDQRSNSYVVAGAMYALRTAGLTVGVYSTGLQWASITGNMPLNGAPLWVAGAGNRRGPGYTASFYCTSGQEGFAGGAVTLVQYGYTGAFSGSFRGATPPYDLDYACPNWRPAWSLHARPAAPAHGRVAVPHPPARPRPGHGPARPAKPEPPGRPAPGRHPVVKPKHEPAPLPAPSHPVVDGKQNHPTHPDGRGNGLLQDVWALG